MMSTEVPLWSRSERVSVVCAHAGPVGSFCIAVRIPKPRRCLATSSCEEVLGDRVSLCGQPTVDDKIVAGDIRGVVRSEIGEGGGYLLRLAETAHWYKGPVLAGALHGFLAAEQRKRHRGVKRSGAD